MAIQIKYAVNMALQYNNANEFSMSDYLVADGSSGKLFLTESPEIRILNEEEKSALYFLLDDTTFTASALYEMYDGSGTKINEEILELGYNYLVHNSIPVNLDAVYVPEETVRMDVSLVGNQNLISFPENYENAIWLKQSAGTGLAPVVTTNNVIAPDGSMTADRIVFDSGVGVGSGDLSIMQQDILSNAGVSYSGYIWLRGNAGGEQILFRHVGASTYTLLTLTNEWVKYDLTEISSGGSFEFGIRQAVNGTINSTATVYAWQSSVTSTDITRLTEIKSYEIDRKCYDFKFMVNWLNKLGGRDTFMFCAKPEIATNVDRNNLIEFSKLTNYESPKRIYGHREHLSHKVYQLAHYCKTRETAEWLKREIIDSIDVCVIINDYYYPVQINNSRIVENKASMDFLVRFDLRLAFDNNIQTR